jgi:predicted glycosyltransferase involved in capsule biosynthesis
MDINGLKLLKSEIDYFKTEILKLKESITFLNKQIYNLMPISENSKEDVSVIIGIRDRYDYKIENALKSLRNQDYDKDLIKIVIVDYGSRIKYFLELKSLCEKYNAEYIRVRRITNWSRSHCLNIGIKRAKTKYILVSDVDIIFENNYLSESVKELKKNPSRVIFSEVFDSLEGDINENTDILKDYSKIRDKCLTRNERTKMYDYTFGLGIIITLNCFFHQINGFDENYKVWGFEDEDLIARLGMIGVELKKIETTSYIHQWHPRYDGIKKEERFQIMKNKEYLNKSYSLKRNRFGWGEL